MYVGPVGRVWCITSLVAVHWASLDLSDPQCQGECWGATKPPLGKNAPVLVTRYSNTVPGWSSWASSPSRWILAGRPDTNFRGKPCLVLILSYLKFFPTNCYDMNVKYQSKRRRVSVSFQAQSYQMSLAYKVCC